MEWFRWCDITYSTSSIYYGEEDGENKVRGKQNQSNANRIMERDIRDAALLLGVNGTSVEMCNMFISVAVFSICDIVGTLCLNTEASTQQVLLIWKEMLEACCKPSWGPFRQPQRPWQQNLRNYVFLIRINEAQRRGGVAVPRRAYGAKEVYLSISGLWLSSQPATCFITV